MSLSCLLGFTRITSHSSKSSIVNLFVCSLFCLILGFGCGFFVCLILLLVSFWSFGLSVFSVSLSSESFCLFFCMILIHFKCFSWFISFMRSFLISIQPKHIVPHVYVNVTVCFPQHTSHTSSFRDLQRDASVSLMITRCCRSQYMPPDICVSPYFWVCNQLWLLTLWDQVVSPDKFQPMSLAQNEVFQHLLSFH